MNYKTREERGAMVVSFEGDVDLQSSPEARKVLLETVGKGLPIMVDLSQVGYIDSSGVASLVESFQAARKAGQSLILVSVSDGARRVLELARLDKVFTIRDSLDDGIAAIG
jgi:anti-sigma B factor antagonist